MFNVAWAGFRATFWLCPLLLSLYALHHIMLGTEFGQDDTGVWKLYLVLVHAISLSVHTHQFPLVTLSVLSKAIIELVVLTAVGSRACCLKQCGGL